MTPKEKAEELIQKMVDTYDITSDFVYDSSAKLCAWIAVNEILKLELQEVYQNADYWEQVKQEIEKL
jgi:hypothetical protein